MKNRVDLSRRVLLAVKRPTRREVVQVYSTPWAVVIRHNPLATGKSIVMEMMLTALTRVETPLRTFTISRGPFNASQFSSE